MTAGSRNFGTLGTVQKPVMTILIKKDSSSKKSA